MEHKHFNVELLFRQRVVYRVAAEDSEKAERLARARWQKFEGSDLAGMDWAQLDSIQAIEAPDAIRQRQDDELVLRFIRERERLLIRLGSPMTPGTSNDSISAVQTATDLGWIRSHRGGALQVDSARAAEALERLCERKQLVCFTRNRVRAGERGEVRLYCTPEYLERLSRELTPPIEPAKGD